MSKKVYGSIQYIDKVQKGELRIDQILSHYDYNVLSRFVNVSGWFDIPHVIDIIDDTLVEMENSGRFEQEGEDILKSIKKRLVKLVKESESE